MSMDFSACTNIFKLQARLRDTDFNRFSPADYRALNRQLRNFQDGSGIKVAYLGNVTMDLLPPYVAAHTARLGWLTQSHVGSFGQHFQALISPQLQTFSAEIIVLVLSLNLLRPDDMSSFTSLSASQRKTLLDGIVDEVESWVMQAVKNTQASLLVSNFASPSVHAFGIADSSMAYGESEFYLELNLELLRRMRKHHRVRILDVNRIVARIGHSQAFDQRLFYIAKMEWTERMLAETGHEITRHIIAACGAARKCLVLDLDNTLWGGIVGEDGIHGVRIGQGDAESEAYAAFHFRLKALKDRGILLALCSKNNIDDIEEIFQLRTDMPLQLADFSARAISWQPKHIGLMDIAKQLNIGLDSLVFLDDSPTEIALIRDQLPQVESILLPADPSQFVAVLDSLSSFEKSAILADDVGKSRQYEAQAAREQLSVSAGSMEDYLHSLQIQLNISDATSDDLLRVHQLFTKTNQFNVTTRRYTLGELDATLAELGHTLRIVSMRDRFGELGIIACYLLVEHGPTLDVDSLMMSCRAMGRGIETAIFNSIKQHFMALTHLKTLTATFIKTSKNMPAAEFFKEQGMHINDEKNDGVTRYSLSRTETALCSCDWIQLEKTPVTSSSQQDLAVH
ncbi:MAG TPA: HAD-IIIC family phosphatase [Methylophilaceae bacterium]|nr:HAD-IIIC family phosphatase [Methylophilaceae bacterium]